VIATSSDISVGFIARKSAIFEYYYQELIYDSLNFSNKNSIFNG